MPEDCGQAATHRTTIRAGTGERSPAVRGQYSGGGPGPYRLGRPALYHASVHRPAAFGVALPVPAAKPVRSALPVKGRIRSGLADDVHDTGASRIPKSITITPICGSKRTPGVTPEPNNPICRALTEHVSADPKIFCELEFRHVRAGARPLNWGDLAFFFLQCLRNLRPGRRGQRPPAAACAFSAGSPKRRRATAPAGSARLPRQAVLGEYVLHARADRAFPAARRRGC